MLMKSGQTRVLLTPEGVLMKLVALFYQQFAAVERFHDLQSAAGDAIRLAKQHRSWLLFHDAGFDIGNIGKLARQRQACGTTADNQYINFVGERCNGRRRVGLSSRVGDLIVTGLKTVEMILHHEILLTLCTSLPSAGLEPRCYIVWVFDRFKRTGIVGQSLSPKNGDRWSLGRERRSPQSGDEAVSQTVIDRGR